MAALTFPPGFRWGVASPIDLVGIDSRSRIVFPGSTDLSGAPTPDGEPTPRAVPMAPRAALSESSEWSHGHTRRFGLLAVDPVTQRRISKDSAQYYRAVATANAVPDRAPSP